MRPNAQAPAYRFCRTLTVLGAALALLLHQPRLPAQTRIREQRLDGTLEGCALDTEGKRYAVALSGSGATLQVFKTKTGKPLRTFHRNLGDIRAIVFSPDGRFLIHSVWADLGEKFGRIRGYQLSSGAKVFEPEGHGKFVAALSLSRDGTRVASAYTDGSVRLWEFATGKLIASMKEDVDPLALSFSPNGRRLAAVGDGAVVVWDLTTTKTGASFRNKPATPVLNSTFVEGGQTLLAIDMSARLFAYDLLRNSSKMRFQLGPQFPRRTATAFSPDGSMLATGDEYGEVRLWDTTTGKELARFKHPRFHGVRCLHFSGDNRFLLSGAIDRVAVLHPTTHLQVWDISKYKKGTGKRGTAERKPSLARPGCGQK